MKTRILINGIIIFIGIGAFFLIMEAIGHSNQTFLRLVNIIFVVFGVNRTIKGNFNAHIDGYFRNLTAAFLTTIVSLALSLLSFHIYLQFKGGEEYLPQLAQNFVFGGGEPNLAEFTIGMAIEGIAAGAVISFAMMQFWKDKLEKINKVDDTNHNTPQSKIE